MPIVLPSKVRRSEPKPDQATYPLAVYLIRKMCDYLHFLLASHESPGAVLSRAPKSVLRVAIRAIQKVSHAAVNV
jgi:hypothetical protein